MRDNKLKRLATGGVWFAMGLLLALIMHKPQLVGLNKLDSYAHQKNLTASGFSKITLLSPRDITHKAFSGIEALARHAKNQATSLNQAANTHHSVGLKPYKSFEKHRLLSVPFYIVGANNVSVVWGLLKESRVISYLIALLLTLFLLILIVRFMGWTVSQKEFSSSNNSNPVKPKQGLFWPLV